MVRYFGPRDDAPIYDDAEEARTPVGEPCAYCEKPIEDGQRGFLIPYLPSLECGGGTHAIGELAYHRICFLTTILGPNLGVLRDR